MTRFKKIFPEICGVDMTMFTAYSVRSASSKKRKAKLSQRNSTLDKHIQKASGWRGSNTFQKLSNLPLLKKSMERTSYVTLIS